MKKIRSIIFVGPAHPFRGGLAGFNHTLTEAFRSYGKKCSIFTFTTQYPSLLFPGKTQYTDAPAPQGLDITRQLSSINPISWIRTGLKVRKRKPDAVIVRYWIPFMAPALGAVCRIARRGGGIKALALLDNVIPHEKRPGDRILTRWFINSVDGFIYMSDQVRDELREFTTDKPAIFSPHPMFTHYGEKLSRAQACGRLGLDENLKYAMFFGFIRDYKGLDLLLEAWAILKASGGFAAHKLIIAGEYYGGRERYEEQIRRLELEEDLILMTHFITDKEISPLFSAVDLVVQPYRTATQSGVTQVAYYYGVPMVVTDVGGLREIVPDGKVGYVVAPDPREIVGAISRFYNENRAEEFKKNIAIERERFTWEGMVGNFDKLYGQVCSGGVQ